MGYLKHTYKIIVIFHVWKYDFSQLWESLLSTPVYVINIFIAHSNARKSNEPIQKSYFKWHPIVFIQQVLSNKPLKETYKTAAWFITNKNHTWLGINRMKSWKSPQWDKAWAISRGIRYTALKNSVVSFFSDVTVSIEGDGLYGRYKVPFHQGHGKRNPPLPQAKNQTHPQGLFSFLPLERERETNLPLQGKGGRDTLTKRLSRRLFAWRILTASGFTNFSLFSCLMGFLWFLLALFFFSMEDEI